MTHTMRKTFIAIILVVFIAGFVTSCASSRKGACPSHNAKYFRA